MNMTNRQKYNDIMSRRADLLEQANAAVAENNYESAGQLTEQINALNGEIETLRNLISEEGKFADLDFDAGMSINDAKDQRDMREERGHKLLLGGAVNFTIDEIMRGLRNADTTVATGTLVKPTRAGTEIRDNFGAPNSILNQVSVINLTGCQAFYEPILATEITANGTDIADSTYGAGTVRSATDPAFSSAKIAPYEVNTTTYVDKNLSRLTPIDYEAKIRELALRALRKKVADLIFKGDQQVSGSDMFGILTGADVSGTALYDTVNCSAVAAGFLDNLVLSYGDDEEIGGGARLYLNKADLIALGQLRGSDSKKIYEISIDAGNPNCGTITDGGLVVPYTISKSLAALSSNSTSANTLTMAYGNARNYELGLFGEYTITVDGSYKAAARMNTIMGDVFVGGNLINKHSFSILKKVAAG